jgi:hypothetical protein
MLRKRRSREDDSGLQDFIQQTAHLMGPQFPEAEWLPQEAPPDSAPAGHQATAGDDFLPWDLRAPADGQFEGRMMRFPGQLTIDGTVRTCPECGVDRDWLILCVGPDIRLRCRSAHETPEPALTSTWYDEVCGPVEALHTTKDAGITSSGFDGTFTGIIFTD